jgi:hypothetical protein
MIVIFVVDLELFLSVDVKVSLMDFVIALEIFQMTVEYVVDQDLIWMVVVD